MADMEPEVKTTSPKKKKDCCASFHNWLGSPSFYIYLNFLMSQWGDWMWQFAVGLYLVRLSNGQLLLAAIFGFCGGGCVLLFGGIIGDWVDRNGRLKVVRISLVMQNMSVMCSAICVCVVLALEPTVITFQYGNVGRILLEVAIIVLAIVAQLSNVAYTIAIEKDWIVVIAQEKSSNLANLNAGIRSLALICKVLSPTTVGVIMTYGSLLTSAIVIASWNLVSVFFEYAILSHIYRMVPRLAVKKNEPPVQEKEMVMFTPEPELTTRPEINSEKSPNGEHAPETAVPLLEASKNSDKKLESEEKKTGNGETKQPDETPDKEVTCMQRILEPFSLLIRGWHTYAQQTVVFAGVSLAFLYMTVLGFDSITLGYIYANDVSELIVAICMGMAGLMGIVGTILFTRLRKRLGLETTGLIAYSAEIGCLVLAVISIWAPGSHFDPFFASRSPQSNCTVLNITVTDSYTSIENLTMAFTTVGLDASQNVTVLTENSCEEEKKSHMSIMLLMIGILSSRVGLWMADLVVTQLMQETVLEKERGIVHGVQNSLNMLMEMLKFVLVIVAPQIEIFGFHIIISFSFICMAGLFFVGHVMRVKRKKRLAAVKEISVMVEANIEPVNEIKANDVQ